MLLIHWFFDEEKSPQNSIYKNKIKNLLQTFKQNSVTIAVKQDTNPVNLM